MCSPYTSKTLQVNGFNRIGGSRGVCLAHALPMGPNSFVFAYIFGKKYLRQRSTPPIMGARPPTGNPGSATESGTKITTMFPKGAG